MLAARIRVVALAEKFRRGPAGVERATPASLTHQNMDALVGLGRPAIDTKYEYNLTFDQLAGRLNDGVIRKKLHLTAKWPGVVLNIRHCQPQHTASYESLDLRMVFLLGALWRGAGLNASFVDVGANCGIYSMVAAGVGHRVLAIDPLPTCISDIEWVRQRNNVAGPITIRRTGISDLPEPFPVPSDICSPYFQVGSRAYVNGSVSSGGVR